jgi:predicted DNA-binding protein
MLGIRLPEEAEKELARHARALGRGKSVIAREWILESLERESIDAQMRRVSQHLSRHESPERLRQAEQMGADALRRLDEEDGGYDWGDKGPPL